MATTAVATVSPGALVAEGRGGDWTPAETSALKSIVPADMNDADLRTFAVVCGHLRLDPFERQVYAWKDRGRLVFHIGIAGWRVQAARSGDYAGQEGPFYRSVDGDWVDTWLDSKPPAAAKVVVHRRGFAVPVTQVVTWDEFSRGLPIWKEKPAHMLGIRAEALALRRAFPEMFEAVDAEMRAVGASYEVVTDARAAGNVSLPAARAVAATGDVTAARADAGGSADSGSEAYDGDYTDAPASLPVPTDGGEVDWFDGLHGEMEARQLGPRDMAKLIAPRPFSCASAIAYCREHSIDGVELVRRAAAKRDEARS